MSCCCNKTYRLCDEIVCDGEDLVLPVPIPADGQYTLELDFLGTQLSRTAMLSMGNNATFEKGELNEEFTYVGHVKAPDGSIVTFTVGSNPTVYDCIEFTTKRAIPWKSSTSSSS